MDESHREKSSDQFKNKLGYHWAKKLPQPIKEFLLRIYWVKKAFLEDFQDYLVEIIGNIPSHHFRLWWFKNIYHLQIGVQSSIHRKCRMIHGYNGHIVIGNNCVINYDVVLDGREGIMIGDNVNIAEGSAIYTLQHDIDDPHFGTEGGPVTIDNHVFIGVNSLILPRVHIGEGAVIAAGAVVTRSVEPYTVVGGIPARFIRYRNRNISYKTNYRRRFG